MYKLLIYNKNTIQSININYASNYIKRLKGLMLQKKFNGLLYKQKYENRYYSTIHTFFMKVEIDIIYLDKKQQLQEITTLKPNKIHIPQKNNTRYIIELFPKTIKKYKIKQKTKLKIIKIT